jgi:hypothetical protein
VAFELSLKYSEGKEVFQDKPNIFFPFLNLFILLYLVILLVRIYFNEIKNYFSTSKGSSMPTINAADLKLLIIESSPLQSSHLVIFLNEIGLSNFTKTTSIPKATSLIKTTSFDLIFLTYLPGSSHLPFLLNLDNQSPCSSNIIYMSPLSTTLISPFLDSHPSISTNLHIPFQSDTLYSVIMKTLENNFNNK